VERGSELKGVLGGCAYPKLWIEVPFRDAEIFHKLEEKLFEPHSPPAEKDVFEFCKLFIQEYGSPLFHPFIEGDSDFSEEPPGFPENMEMARTLWRNLVPASDGEPKSRSVTLPEQQVKRGIALIANAAKKRTARKRRNS
jgi:hypothetical protein